MLSILSTFNDNAIIAMKLDRYELKAGRSLTTFEFLSEGRKGKIVKVVQFQRMNLPNLFNLAFGDKNLETGEIDDLSISDNGDSEKVLATVVAALYAFVNEHPGCWVYATGSTGVRTRLYQTGINKYFDIVKADFDIMGELLNEWEPYEKGKNYQAFAVQRKKS
jgi:hypothetical protein